MQRISSDPILVCVWVTLDAMLNFYSDFDTNTDVKCERSIAFAFASNIQIGSMATSDGVHTLRLHIFKNVTAKITEKRKRTQMVHILYNLLLKILRYDSKDLKSSKSYSFL